MPGSACVTPIDRRPLQPRGAPVHLPGATRSSRTQDSRRRRRRLALGRGPLPPLPLQGRAPGARGRLGHGEDRAGQGLRDARAPGGSGLMGTRVAPPSAREEEEETKASLARPRRAPSPRLTCLASPPEPNLDSSSLPARASPSVPPASPLLPVPARVVFCAPSPPAHLDLWCLFPAALRRRLLHRHSPAASVYPSAKDSVHVVWNLSWP